MAIIGNFTKSGKGYQGSLTTLSLKVKLSLTPVEKAGDKSPDFRVYSDSAEIGAAWKATSKEGKAYLSVKIDDPSFPSPIMAGLVETGQGHALVWNR